MNKDGNAFTSKVIGIECEIDHPNSVNTLLRFEGIDFVNYYFDVVDALLFSEGQIVSVPDTLEADDFKKLFEDDPYFPCLNLRVYPMLLQRNGLAKRKGSLFPPKRPRRRDVLPTRSSASRNSGWKITTMATKPTVKKLSMIKPSAFISNTLQTINTPNRAAMPSKSLPALRLLTNLYK